MSNYGCAWCGAAGVSLHGSGEWNICISCTIAVCWPHEPTTPVPARELERIYTGYVQQRLVNEAHRPAGLPALTPDVDAVLVAISQQRATAADLAPYRELLLARNVCYFCATRIGGGQLGASGPNVNICRDCLAAARATHGLVG